MEKEKDHNNEIISNITQNDDGKFEVSIPGAGKFDRKCRRRIESKTETIIQMPYKKPSSNDSIQVCGSTHSSVELAISEIESIIAQQQRRHTHFLSIPIHDEGIVAKFVQFKDEVMKDNANFTDEYFQKTFKLHLSLGVLSLYSDERRSSAMKALQECRDIIDSVKTRFNITGDLRISVSGVKCMNDNPSNCRVLYGMVESEIIQAIVDLIVDHFVAKGLIEEEKDHVKLHVTMMNAVFVKRITKKRCKKFDASGIVEKFPNYEFGDQTFNEIHLSRFERTGEFTYYQNDGILKI